MATEDQKKERMLKVMNIAMYGLIDGLWDLFGESSFATVHSISDKILSMMEKEAGLEIAGENPEGPKLLNSGTLAIQLQDDKYAIRSLNIGFASPLSRSGRESSAGTPRAGQELGE